jgi:hypothetical protein
MSTLVLQWREHDKLRSFFIYLWGCSGTQSNIIAPIYWHIVPALDDKW